MASIAQDGTRPGEPGKRWLFMPPRHWSRQELSSSQAAGLITEGRHCDREGTLSESQEGYEGTRVSQEDGQ